jgi:hypothetical protein
LGPGVWSQCHDLYFFYGKKVNVTNVMMADVMITTFADFELFLSKKKKTML